MEKTKKPVAFALALVLVVALAVAGTIAWLTARSGEVVNTFTAGDINIELTETDAVDLEEDGVWTKGYKMVPGDTLSKDPKVTVKAGSEKCFLFVKVKEDIDPNLTFADYLYYEPAAGWTSLGTNDGVTRYYRVVEMKDADQGFDVIKGNQVKVNETVTKQMMEALEGKKFPTLTFQAFAVQYDNVKVEGNDAPSEVQLAEAAWALL